MRPGRARGGRRRTGRPAGTTGSDEGTRLLDVERKGTGVVGRPYAPPDTQLTYARRTWRAGAPEWPSIGPYFFRSWKAATKRSASSRGKLSRTGLLSTLEFSSRWPFFPFFQ